MNEKGIGLWIVVILQMVKQQRYEDLSDFIEKECRIFAKNARGNRDAYDVLLQLKEDGYIKFIKGKKNQNQYSKARIDKRGEKLLEDIETPEITEEDLIFFDWVVKEYEKRKKKIGNRKKLKLYIALFRTHSGIDKNRLAILIKSFLEDEKQQEFSYVAEYIFFKPPNVFTTKFDIEQSRLYQYYLRHKESFDKSFEKIETNG